MGYELRINRVSFGVFSTPEEGLAAAKRALRDHPNCEPEILDTETGRAFEPAASERWRDELANKIGY